MKKQIKVGRPKKEESKNHKTNTRFTQLEYNKIQEQADLLEMSVSEFMRKSALNPSINNELSSCMVMELLVDIGALRAIIDDVSLKLTQNPHDVSFELQERLNSVLDVLLRVESKV